MASNAASAVQFRVNGTEMARGRTKLSAARAWTLELSPAPRGASKGKRRDNRDEREFILGPENAGNFCIARRSRGISAMSAGDFPEADFWATSWESALAWPGESWRPARCDRNGSGLYPGLTLMWAKH
jgi:hypothetical protein